MRDDVDTKNELHQRSEDLKEALWVLVDKRRDENQEERNRIIKNGTLSNESFSN